MSDGRDDAASRACATVADAKREGFDDSWSFHELRISAFPDRERIISAGQCSLRFGIDDLINNFNIRGGDQFAVPRNASLWLPVQNLDGETHD